MRFPDRIPPHPLRSAVAAAFLLALAACGSDKEEEYVERPVEELYNEGFDSLHAGENDDAAGFFDEVERQHPYSTWATRAQLMAAYAHYREARYDDALNGIDRFLSLHPGHQSAPYAYYLRALCYYEQIADVTRDQKNTELALGALSEVVRRYPGTDYARDAQLKIDLTYDHLAGKDMEIGRFYLTRGEYQAAINRFRRVIEQYQTTTHVPEALHRLTEAYLALGIVDEAQTAAAVLGHNYPGSEWYADSYLLLTGVDSRPQENKGSWISRTFGAIF
ncbi:MAG TPA: outer membrane protein assembly factor BamD [Methylomirabilota bacterium]|jgi:outer membrane protein assembly factor BamD|nr:outer membrane protein assembly factor BamD [Methylomirabilota bacterium]